MKTYRCWEEVSSAENLWRAWREFARGKGMRPNVAAFAIEADRHIHRLARLLYEGRYRPGAYKMIRITDPKRRLVSAAPVRDRVVHHALHRVLSPRLDKRFIEQSYACLPGRGSHRAILRFLGELRRWRWVLQLDVSRYFYSIDRGILRALLFRSLPELPLRGLLDVILDSGAGLYTDPVNTAWLGWSSPMPAGLGLPIGNLTSQWWGNLYLDGLDHFAKRQLRVPSYQRYMDDFALFGDDPRALVVVRDALADWLQRERGLRLKHPHARPRRCDRLHSYLGYRIARGGIVLGPKARGRIPAILRSKVDDPESLLTTTASLASSWMFGS